MTRPLHRDAAAEGEDDRSRPRSTLVQMRRMPRRAADARRAHATMGRLGHGTAVAEESVRLRRPGRKPRVKRGQHHTGRHMQREQNRADGPGTTTRGDSEQIGATPYQHPSPTRKDHTQATSASKGHPLWTWNLRGAVRNSPARPCWHRSRGSGAGPSADSDFHGPVAVARPATEYHRLVQTCLAWPGLVSAPHAGLKPRIEPWRCPRQRRGQSSCSVLLPTTGSKTARINGPPGSAVPRPRRFTRLHWCSACVRPRGRVGRAIELWL